MTDQPLLRVVAGGEPTDEELAALVVALTARSQAPTGAARRSRWADRAAALRRPLPTGADAWRGATRAPR